MCTFRAFLFFALVVLFNNSAHAADTNQLEINIFFETNDFKLDSNNVFALNDLIAQINPKLINQISLLGMADDRGDQDHNLKLSKKRCAAVAKYLEKHCYANVSISIKALGEQAEPFRNVDQLRAKNRSVIVTLMSTSILNTAATEPQFFKINPSKNEVCRTKSGVRIEIPAYTFEQEKGGRIFGNVELEIKEYLSTSDFIAAGLNTISGNEMLQSGGMFDISATYNGDRKPTINQDKPLKVIIPVDTALPDMQVFYQSHNQDLDLETWDISGIQAWRGIAAVRDVISFKTAMERLGEEEFDMKDEVLSLFAKPGNEEELAFLAGKIIRTKDENRLKRLLLVAPIEELYVAVDDYTYSQTKQPSKLYPVFKRSTQREVRFSDSSFDPVDFDKITGVRLSMRRMEEMYDLRMFNKQNANIDSITSKNIVKQFYEMNVTTLGLVNCDRFLRGDFPNTEKIQLAVNLGKYDKNSMNFALAFPELNCIMPAVIQKDGVMRTGPIPIGQKATIVAYTTNAEGILADIREIEIKDPEIALNLKQIDQSELNDILQKLN